MLYLLKSNKSYKVGYTRDEESLTFRLRAYKTHNPEFVLIGLREGSKEDEKFYHDLMKVTRSSEWADLIDESLEESLLAEFTFDYKFLTKISNDFEECYDDIEEPYSYQTLYGRSTERLNQEGAFYHVVLTDAGLFVINFFTRKRYKTASGDVKVFYLTLESGELLRGFTYNDKIVYTIRPAMYIPDPIIPELGLVGDFSGRIYEEIKDHLTDFKFELNG
jgi:hypothetical protein